MNMPSAKELPSKGGRYSQLSNLPEPPPSGSEVTSMHFRSSYPTTEHSLQRSRPTPPAILLALACLLFLNGPAMLAQDPPNIILFILDDVGIENFDFYNIRGPNGPYADTEFLTELSLEGVRFNNAWSNPLCSPTRAAMHTGSFAFRTGIGDVIENDATYGLVVSDPNLLPKLLASTAESTTGYSTGLFGKWHLGTSEDQENNNAPQVAGYDNFFATFLDEQIEPPADDDVPYFHFWETRDGGPFPPVPITAEFDARIDDEDPNDDDPAIYLTNHMVTRAIDWINDQEGPWFAYVPFGSAHDPWGCPLNSEDSPYPDEDFECSEQTPNNDLESRSMIETIDIEIERLLTETFWSAEETLVIIASDNGSAAQLNNDPFNANYPKGTVGQGGVKVPLLIVGPGVTAAGEAVDSSVNLTDLYATILDVAAKTALKPSPTDSVSLIGFFDDSEAAAVHSYNYTETFWPNFDPTTDHGPCRGMQAVQEDPGLYETGAYKYVRLFGGQEALFNLANDPFEGTNVINSGPSARLQALRNHIEVTLGSRLDLICNGLLETGQNCTDDSQCCSGMCAPATQSPRECLCPAP